MGGATLGARQTVTPAAGFLDRSGFHAAVDRVPRTVPVWRGEEGPRPFVAFTPGGVQIGTRDLARVSASEERRTMRRLRDSVKAGSASPEDAARFAAWSWDNPDMSPELLEAPPGPTRGRVVRWSEKSRWRMARMLTTFDYTPVLGEGTRPAMLTLTLPLFWLELCPNPRAFRRAVETFWKKYETAWGHAVRCVWKLEYQRRGAPHLHVLLSIPEGKRLRPLSRSEVAHLRACKRVECSHSSHFAPDVEFPEWASWAWAHSVGMLPRDRFPALDDEAFDRLAHEQFMLHVGQGAHVSEDETMRYGDPRRVAEYFAKHGAFAEKEYQNDIPAEWLEAIEAGESSANYWGSRQLERVRDVVEVDAQLIICIARVIRGWVRSRAYSRPVRPYRSRAVYEHPPFCRECAYAAKVARAYGERPPGVAACPARVLKDVPRVWSRSRRVSRKVKMLRGWRGFVAVNSGAAVAGMVARLLEDQAWTRPTAGANPRPLSGLEAWRLRERV